MTFVARVISFLLLCLFVFAGAVRYTSAGYILKPIPENPLVSHLELPTLQLEPAHTSFGTLLGAPPATKSSSFMYMPKATISAEISTESAVLAASTSANPVGSILSTLELIAAQQLEEQKKFEAQYITPSPTPTPYASDLLERLSALLNLQSTLSTLYPAEQAYTYTPPPQSVVPTPTESPRKIYKIAILGDSMVDTLGRDLSDLRSLLNQSYPGKTFSLLNYGQGSTDLESGLRRLTSESNYLNTYYPPLLSQKPDILIIESFAYNPWSGSLNDLNRQWSTLGKILDTVRSRSPETRIILAAAIGPNDLTFGDGKLNWGKQAKWDKSNIIKAYLNNAIRFGQSAGVPVADAYHPSLGSDGNGLQKYINQGDHIHPSKEGALLFSQKIIETINTAHLIQ